MSALGTYQARHQLLINPILCFLLPSTRQLSTAREHGTTVQVDDVINLWPPVSVILFNIAQQSLGALLIQFCHSPQNKSLTTPPPAHPPPLTMPRFQFSATKSINLITWIQSYALRASQHSENQIWLQKPLLNVFWGVNQDQEGN